MAEMHGKFLGNEHFVTGRDKNKISVLFYPATTKDAPLLVDLHGGGFVLGHHYLDDQLCDLLNKKLDFNVASIEYRYAPEAVYPTATYDCLDALIALCGDARFDFDREQIYLLGHSAGANIAAGINLLAEGKLGIRGQVLNYPFLDISITPSNRAYLWYSIPPFVIQWSINRYFPDTASRSEPLASPVSMTAQQAAKMPPTLVLTCGRDSLRVDGIRFAKLLNEAGVNAQHTEYQDAVHGFIETVPNGSMAKSWWLPKKVRRVQTDLFNQAVEDICSFLA